MTEAVRCVSKDSDIDEAERLTGTAQIRRLPVVDADKHLIGMLSLGDLAVGRERGVGATLEKISQPNSTDR